MDGLTDQWMNWWTHWFRIVFFWFSLLFHTYLVLAQQLYNTTSEITLTLQICLPLLYTSTWYNGHCATMTVWIRYILSGPTAMSWKVCHSFQISAFMTLMISKELWKFRAAEIARISWFDRNVRQHMIACHFVHQINGSCDQHDKVLVLVTLPGWLVSLLTMPLIICTLQKRSYLSYQAGAYMMGYERH